MTARLPDDLASWVEDVGGGRLALADRKQGGARKEAWFVDLERPDGTTAHLFLRYDRSDPARTRDPWTLHREATVYLALQDGPVPVPRVLGVHPVHQAMLAERVTGENWFSRISDPAEQEATARDFMTKLAALHSLDAAALDLPAFPAVRTVADAVHAELDEWERVLAERGGTPDPALAFSLRWLRRHVPDYAGPPVLVQGDTGPGNFMYEGGSCHRRGRLGVGAPRGPHGRHRLAVAAGDPGALHRFPDPSARVRGALRQRHRRGEGALLPGDGGDEAPGDGPPTGCCRTGGGGQSSADTDVGNGFIYQMLHRRLWLEALAAATGLVLTPAEAPRARDGSDHDWMYDAVLAQLRDVIVPRTSDPLASARGKGIARLVKYLAQVDTYGASYEVFELDDLEALLGRRPESVALGRRAAADAVASGGVSDEAYLEVLWRRVARETELARPSMGALADRHWPDLVAS